jgi:hypothetical protein
MIPPPKEKEEDGAPGDLQYVGHPIEKSVEQVLVPVPPFTRLRVIPGPLSQLCERAIFLNINQRRRQAGRDLQNSSTLPV